MKKLVLIAFLASGLYSFGQTVWINEIHYDNSGADLNEGFEIAAPAGTDLSCYDVILYNGGTNNSYATINLSGIVPDNGCGIGTVWFSYAGIQNGGPDGIALYNTCTSTLIQFLSYEGSFTAGNGPAAGQTSTDIGVSESGSTLSTQSLQLSGGPGTDYTDFTWQTAGASTNGSTNTGQDFCTACTGPDPEPTNEVSGVANNCVTCGGFSLDWTLGAGTDSVIVVVSDTPITNPPTDGVNYAPGEFTGGDDMVMYNGSGTSTTIGGLNPSTTYYYAIYSYNGQQLDCEENYLVGGITGTVTTGANCSYIQSINYNACTTGSEGTDEIIVVNIANDVNIDDIVLGLPNTTWCNSGCGANTLVNNAAFINSLNTMAGCTIFQYCDPVPAGSTLMIFTGNPPSTVLDYSGNCGGVPPPYCAVFLDNSSTTGNFSNSSGPKTTTIDFGCGDSSSVAYDPTTYSNVDGATADYDASGNVTYNTNVDCIYPLALNLRSFYGYQEENMNRLQWTSSFDFSASYFEVRKSINGVIWETIGTVEANRESGSNFSYSFDDLYPFEGISYYRLATFDMDGVYQLSDIISVDRSSISTYYTNNLITVGFTALPNKTYTLNIYDLSGALIRTEVAYPGMQIPWNRDGFFILEIPELGLKTKLITQ